MPPRGTTGDYNNFAPRVGFAYDLTGDGRMSVRGGAGVFYDSRTAGVINNRFVDITPFSTQVTLTDPRGPFSNPYLGIANPFPASFPPPKDTPFTRPVLVVTYDPSTKFIVPETYNWNVGVTPHETQCAGEPFAAGESCVEKRNAVDPPIRNANVA